MPSREEEHLLLKMKGVEIISEVFTSRNNTALLSKFLLDIVRQYLTETAASNSQEADSDRTVIVWTAMMGLEMCTHLLQPGSQVQVVSSTSRDVHSCKNT